MTKQKEGLQFDYDHIKYEQRSRYFDGERYRLINPRVSSTIKKKLKERSNNKCEQCGNPFSHNNLSSRFSVQHHHDGFLYAWCYSCNSRDAASRASVRESQKRAIVRAEIINDIGHLNWNVPIEKVSDSIWFAIMACMRGCNASISRSGLISGSYSTILSDDLVRKYCGFYLQNDDPISLNRVDVLIQERQTARSMGDHIHK